MIDVNDSTRRRRLVVIAFPKTEEQQTQTSIEATRKQEITCSRKFGDGWQRGALLQRSSKVSLEKVLTMVILRRGERNRNGMEERRARKGDGRQAALSGLRRSSFFSSRLVLAALPASGFGGSRHSSTAFYLTLETRRCRATFRVYGKCSTERNRNASERSSKNKASGTAEDGEHQGKRESDKRNDEQRLKRKGGGPGEGTRRKRMEKGGEKTDEG